MLLYPLDEVPHGLWAGDDIERRRQRASFFKVTHPQLRSCKFPFNVCMILQMYETMINSIEQHFHTEIISNQNDDISDRKYNTIQPCSTHFMSPVTKSFKNLNQWLLSIMYIAPTSD